MQLHKYTYIELHVAGLKFRLEQQGKFLVHHTFGAFLFGTFDFFQLHVSQVTRKMSCGLLQFQIASIV